jgi:triosephosphate isomerase (TIM)
MEIMRKRIIAGNWKMNKTVPEAVALAEAVRNGSFAADKVDVVLCPPFVDLYAVHQVIMNEPIGLGGQDMFWEEKGAFTGQVSAAMLLSTGCTHVIIGHSERRQFFNEIDESINKKARRALQAGLIPIICVGETLQERQSELTEKVLETQVRGCVKDFPAPEAAKIVIAYEPVWAIGTGVVATTEQAQQAHAFIRKLLSQIFGQEIADSIRIQYGGSMKPDNATQLLAQPDIDGGLIGGASLDAKSFLEIVNA